MGRGSYLGGCTVVGPRSGWFSKRQQQLKSKKNPTTRASKAIASKPAMGTEAARARSEARAAVREMHEKSAAATREKERLSREEMLARRAGRLADAVAIEQLAVMHRLDRSAFAAHPKTAGMKKSDPAVKKRLAAKKKEREESRVMENERRQSKRNAYRLIKGRILETPSR
jgi:hypothetical protein